MLTSFYRCPDCNIEQECDPYEVAVPDKFERKPITELRIRTTEVGPAKAIIGMDMGIVVCKKCGRIAMQVLRGKFPDSRLELPEI